MLTKLLAFRNANIITSFKQTQNRKSKYLLNLNEQFEKNKIFKNCSRCPLVFEFSNLWWRGSIMVVTRTATESNLQLSSKTEWPFIIFFFLQNLLATKSDDKNKNPLQLFSIFIAGNKCSVNQKELLRILWKSWNLFVYFSLNQYTERYSIRV